MTKALLRSAAFSAGLIVPSAAAAQAAPSSCPPGSWFCVEPPPQEQAAPAGKPVQALTPLPKAEGAGEAAPPPGTPPPPPPASASGPSTGPSFGPPGAPRPPQGEYGPPPAPPYAHPEVPPAYGPPGYGPPPYAYPYPPRYYPYPPPPPLPFREWGLNLHLMGAAIGRGTYGNAGMGGGGVGLRFKPTPRFGVEADLDFLGGTDYQGDARGETAFSFNGLVFLNPQSMAQIYLLAGLGGSTAHVTCDPANGCPGGAYDAQYSYFGGQVGMGLELRLGRVLALNADLRGFLRTRTDSLAQSQPEFVDANGRSTNTSAGALLTAGITFYF